MNEGQGKSLVKKLEAILSKLERGRTNADCNQLQDFINQVNDLTGEGVLAPSEGQALVDAATLVIGVPTTLIGPHPKVAYAAFLVNALRPKTRFASIIGSYGWGSQAKEQIIKMIPNLKVELLETVIVKGLPKEEDLRDLDSLAATIAQKHKNMNVSAA